MQIVLFFNQSILIYKKTRVSLYNPSELGRRIKTVRMKCTRGIHYSCVAVRRVRLHFNYRAVSLDSLENDFTTNNWPLSTGSRRTHLITQLVWCYFNPSNNNVRFCHPLAFAVFVWGVVQENTAFPVSILVSHRTIARPAGRINCSSVKKNLYDLLIVLQPSFNFF